MCTCIYKNVLSMYCLIFISEMDTTGMKIVKVRGVKFQIDSSGKTLKRLDSSPSKTGMLKDKKKYKMLLVVTF